MAETYSMGNLAVGKPVVGSDGADVGTVNGVVENPSLPPGTPGSAYVEVNTGGFLGIGGSRLYVPVSAVAEAPHGGKVILSCTE